MILAVAVATKNIKNAAGVKLRAFKLINAGKIKACLFSVFSLYLITACSDSDINIPGKHSKTLIAIYSPANGATLSANKPFILDYEVLRAVKSSYVKIQVDKTTPITVVKIRGRHHINGLSEGVHIILISEYRSDGKPSGSQATIKILVK